jgi:hypothetical protein
MLSEKRNILNLRNNEQKEEETLKINCINGYFLDESKKLCVCNEGYKTSENISITNGFIDKCNEKINSNEETILYETEQKEQVTIEIGKTSSKVIIIYVCLIVLILVLITWIIFKITKIIRKYCCCLIKTNKKKDNKKKKINKKNEEASYENSSEDNSENNKKDKKINKSFASKNNTLKTLNSNKQFYICEGNGDVLMEIKHNIKLTNILLKNQKDNKVENKENKEEIEKK